MAGLLEDYGIDFDEIVGGGNLKDDIYEFVVGDVFVKEGNSKDANKHSLVIQYLLGEHGNEKQEWFGIPKDSANMTKNEALIMGFYKDRMVDLGASPDEVDKVQAEDLIGLTGTLQLVTAKGYQNVKNVRLDENSEPLPDTPPERAKRPEKDPAEDEPKAAPAKRRAPAARAKAETAVANPFAAKA